MQEGERTKDFIISNMLNYGNDNLNDNGLQNKTSVLVNSKESYETNIRGL